MEYTLKVPRRARLFAVETVNGGVDVAGVAGNIKASSVNGTVVARNLESEAQLSTVNGRVEASFEKLQGTPSISLHTVNGSISLSIPDKSNAELNASTVHGRISSDFGVPVSNRPKAGRIFQRKDWQRRRPHQAEQRERQASSPLVASPPVGCRFPVHRE